MAAPLIVTLEQSRRYRFGDYAQVEVDGALQPDRFQLWHAERRQLGFGRGRFGRGRFGRGRSLGFGLGAFGRGVFGQGARLAAYRTAAAHPAGDYTLRVRAVDRLGNAGDWSAPLAHEHRPRPPAPARLRVDGEDLAWAWSDPTG